MPYPQMSYSTLMCSYYKFVLIYTLEDTVQYSILWVIYCGLIVPYMLECSPYKPYLPHKNVSVVPFFLLSSFLNNHLVT